MIAEALAIATMVVAGIPVAIALDAGSKGSRLAGEGFLLGSGSAAVVLLFASHAGVPWSAGLLLASMAATSLAAGLFARGRSKRSPEEGAGCPLSRLSIVEIALDATTAGLFVLYVTFATLTRPWNWDFWAIWGLKAKVFFAARGIDWVFLGDRWHAYAHGEYPPLLPLVFDVPTLLRGEWSDRWIALISVSFSAAALLVLRRHVLDETGDRRVAAVASLAATGPALAGWVGLADVPFLALATAGVLSIRRAMLHENSGRSGAVMIGLAALTKNEGVALLVAVAIATVLSCGRERVRRFLALWPAFVLTALWQIPRLTRGLESDLFLGDAAGRLSASRVLEAMRLVAAEPMHHPLFWAAIAVALIVGIGSLRSEVFLVSTLALQFGFMLVTYAVTANDIAWQVTMSWKRVSDHLALIALFLAVVVLFRWSRTSIGPMPASDGEEEGNVEC